MSILSIITLLTLAITPPKAALSTYESLEDFHCINKLEGVINTVFIKDNHSILESFRTEPLIIRDEEAGVYGKDDRIKPSMNVFPYRAMGKISSYIEEDTDGNKVKSKLTDCTATLVSPCHLITASHCVKNYKEKRNGLFSKNYELTTPKYSGGSSNKGSKLQHSYEYTDSRGQVHGFDKVKRGKNYDYALIKLKTNPGKELGHVGVLRKSATQFKAGYPVEAAGYSGDIDQGQDLTTDRSAVVASAPRRGKNRELYLGGTRKKNWLLTKSDLFPGSSGGPVLAKDDNGVSYIIGINSAGPTVKKGNGHGQLFLGDDEKQIFSIAVTTNAFYDDMRSFIKKNECN
jgi:V8-like Glu-specific endopeptidase